MRNNVALHWAAELNWTTNNSRYALEQKLVRQQQVFTCLMRVNTQQRQV
jgi:hypothetical protein